MRQAFSVGSRALLLKLNPDLRAGGSSRIQLAGTGGGATCELCGVFQIRYSIDGTIKLSKLRASQKQPCPRHLLVQTSALAYLSTGSLLAAIPWQHAQKFQQQSRAGQLLLVHKGVLAPPCTHGCRFFALTCALVPLSHRCTRACCALVVRSNTYGRHKGSAWGAIGS